MSREWRAHLLLNSYGSIDQRAQYNFVTMLRIHPDMTGVFGRRGADRMVLQRPFWDAATGWKPRMLEHLDHVQVKMWLQHHGLRPYLNQTIAAMRHVCDENPI